MRNKLRKYFLAHSPFLFGFVFAIVFNLLANWYYEKGSINKKYDHQTYSKLQVPLHPEEQSYFHNLETRNVTDGEYNENQDRKAVTTDLVHIERKLNIC